MANNAGAPGGGRGRSITLTHHILVVDDDRAMRVLLKKLLEGEGHTVETAVDGRDALDGFEAGRYSLVISDVVMPGLSGIELRAELGEREPALPCLLVSGADIEGGLRFAATTYRTVFLAKPFQPEELIDLVRATPDRSEYRAAS